MSKWQEVLSTADQSPLIWTLVAFGIVLTAPAELQREAFSFIIGAVTVRIRTPHNT